MHTLIYNFSISFQSDLDRRQRLDMYVCDHLEALKGQLCISIAQAKKSKELGATEEIAVTPIEVGQSIDNYEARKSQRAKERQSRSRSSILNPLNSTNTIVPIFPNGCDNLSEQKLIIELINTCGFDSIVSMFCCLYFDYESYRNIVDQEISSQFSRLLQLIYQQRRIEQAHEQIRYEILKRMLTKTSFLEETSNLIHINAGTTLNFMYTRVFINGNKFIGSKTETSKCMSCGSQREIMCSHINIILDEFDFRNVEKGIEANNNRQCTNCMQDIPAIEIKYNTVVAIDTEQTHFGGENIFSCKIDDITKTICLNEVEYELCGVIEHQPNPEHFISHVKRQSNEWLTYDDLVGRQYGTNVKDEIFVHMLFYKRKQFGK